MDCNIRHHVVQQFRFCFLDQIKKEYFNPAYRYSRDAKTEDEVHHFQNVHFFKITSNLSDQKYRGCRTIPNMGIYASKKISGIEKFVSSERDVFFSICQ